MTTWTKDKLLSKPVVHIDPKVFDARPVIDAYGSAAFSARTLARASDIVNRMVGDTDCTVILTLAGSLISAGMKEAILTLLEHNMVDAIVSTGANIVDQDFFEGLGFQHYIAPGSPEAPVVDDTKLRDLAIDRIYDTYINEDELRECDDTTKRIFDELEPAAYSSRELVEAMGAYLDKHHPKARSIVLECYRRAVPIFVPAFSDCSAGFGIVLHQMQRRRQGKPMIAFDSGKDFLELTELKIASIKQGGTTGLFMLAGGVPKNFAQDIVVAAELLAEHEPELNLDLDAVSMHRYAVQFTVADSRDGALSGSTLREACSWGKVDVVDEQMVFGELSALLPLVVSDVYHRGSWKQRKARRLADTLRAVAPVA